MGGKLIICYGYCMIYLYASPFGNISYDWDGAVCRHLWLNPDDQQHLQHDDPVSIWLDYYFKGSATALPPLDQAATRFQQRMREALCEISVGEVRSYAEIAQVLQTSPRGIGQALKANPLPILIPCHRIVAVGGLGGFAGGERWKVNLLRFESMV